MSRPRSGKARPLADSLASLEKALDAVDLSLVEYPPVNTSEFRQLKQVLDKVEKHMRIAAKVYARPSTVYTFNGERVDR